LISLLLEFTKKARRILFLINKNSKNIHDEKEAAAGTRRGTSSSPS
jgi:hypothetical protein